MYKKAIIIGALAALAGPVQAATIVGSFAAALSGVESSTFGIGVGSTLTNANGFVTGVTGDLSGVSLGTSISFAPVTAINGTSVSFTSDFGSFTGTLLNLLTAPAPNASVNFNALGSFTPAGSLSGFMEGLASLTVSFTQTGDLVTGSTQPAVSGSFTFASPPTIGDGTPDGVPEPASWALLIVGFGLTGIAMRRRGPRVAAY